MQALPFDGYIPGGHGSSLGIVISMGTTPKSPPDGSSMTTCPDACAEGYAGQRAVRLLQSRSQKEADREGRVRITPLICEANGFKLFPVVSPNWPGMTAAEPAATLTRGCPLGGRRACGCPSAAEPTARTSCCPGCTRAGDLQPTADLLTTRRPAPSGASGSTPLERPAPDHIRRCGLPAPQPVDTT